MPPRRWQIEGREPSAGELDEIAALLKTGGVVILPTDTIYGLHAAAGDVSAVEAIFRMKERERRKPLVVVVSSIDQLVALPVRVSGEVRMVLASIWPARLTAVLPLDRPLPAAAGGSSLGVRVPDLRWLRELLERTGPLASTSVNLSGEPAIEAVETLPESVENRVAGVVNSGRLTSKPSTVVDFTKTPPGVLREGAVEFSQNLWKRLRKTL